MPVELVPDIQRFPYLSLDFVKDLQCTCPLVEDAIEDLIENHLAQPAGVVNAVCFLGGLTSPPQRHVPVRPREQSKKARQTSKAQSHATGSAPRECRRVQTDGSE